MLNKNEIKICQEAFILSWCNKKNKNKKLFTTFNK